MLLFVWGLSSKELGLLLFSKNFVANGKTKLTVVDASVGNARVDVHVPSVRRGDPRGRPIVAVRTSVAMIRVVPSNLLLEYYEWKKLTILVV